MTRLGALRARPLRPLVTALVLVLVVAGALGLTAGPASSAGTGVITGTVTGPGGEPLAGIAVTAYEIIDQEVYRVDGTRTRVDGSYELADLGAGVYRLRFRDLDSTFEGEYWDDAATVYAATPITLAAGQTVVGKDAQLTTGGHITGTVTGPDDQPLPDVTAVVYQATYDEDEDWEYWDYLDDVTTGPDGSYDTGALPAGTYRLGFFGGGDYLVEYWDDAATLGDATDIEVAAGQVVGGTDAQLATAGHITGTVTGPGGAGVEYVAVVAYQWDPDQGSWDWADYTTTWTDGSYDLSGLPSGTYRLGFFDDHDRYLSEFWDDATWIEDATDIPVTAGGTVSGKDAELAPGGHITGTVTGLGGGPLEGIDVDVYAWDSEEKYWDWAGSTWTDEDGTYDVAGLPTGRYRIGFYDEYDDYVGEYWDDAASWGAATDIDVTAGQTAGGKDARLAATTSGDGHVGGTVAGPDGQPLSAISVRAYRWTGSQWNWVAGTMTDGAGGYDLTLPPGDYALGFEDPSGAYVEEYWNDAPRVETATPIHVGAGTNRTDVSPRLAAAVRSVTNVVAPTITGSLHVGETLVAGTGSWSPAATEMRFQWLVNGVAVPGATGPTYTPTSADANTWIQVQVTASTPGYADATATSPRAHVGFRLFQVLKKPFVQGKLRRGSVLHLMPGKWRHVRPTLTWAWYADGERILGANNRPLRLRGRIAKLVTGKRISVGLLAEADGYKTIQMKVRARGRLR